MIRCVVFDFDGTLVDSNQIKRDSFFAVVDTIPDGPEIMGEIFSDPDRGNRHSVFERFARLAGLPAGANEKLTRLYSIRCSALIDACPDMPGAEAAMATLYAQERHLFINSATPEAELQPIVQARSFCRFVDGVFGGPAAKSKNLEKILNALHMPPEEVAVVGDGTDDHAAARQIGCDFVPVFAYSDTKTGALPPLRTLAHLPATIDNLSSQLKKGAYE